MAPTVVSASVGVLGPLLAKLTTLLADECGRLKGVRREIRLLKSELITMHGALIEYTELKDPDEQTKRWISLVRELSYDTEDVFDKFIYQLGNGQDQGGFKEFLRRTARCLKSLGARRGFARQIDDLNVRIKQVKELKDSYRLKSDVSSTTGHVAMDSRLQALLAEERHLVGIDGPRDDLAKWMVEGSNTHRKVLSIIGFGGIGKTTLANQVYCKIKGYFDCRAFVSVSQKPNIENIIKDVISQVSWQDGCSDNLDEIKSITKLRELLQDKRYLVIIDDIWCTRAWERIKCAFPENNCSSRIIATTRVVDVARSCRQSGDDRIYQMEPLSDLHSKRLFFKRIFGSEDCCLDMLKEVSSEILKKCGGLPLAIISISSLLATKPVVREEWENTKRFIGHLLQKDRSLDNISSILLLSYNDLAPDLKTCLLYLSAFPEDHVIERHMIVRQWIAEGFVPEEHGLSQQDVAEHYFYELINKSMVQPLGIRHDGTVHACRVHDMMLEILISKSVEDNFMTVVTSGENSLANHRGVIRRLSIQHIDEDVASALENENLAHVRSLTITTSSGCIKHLPRLAKFEVLRVLDLAFGENLEEYIMKGLDKFFQLKYLKLKDRSISKLPPGIVKLRDLESLDFRGTSVNELPTCFAKLTKLRHLVAAPAPPKRFSGCRRSLPTGIGYLSRLRVISGFNITQSSADVVEDLANLTNLTELDIHLDDGESSVYNRNEEMLRFSLEKLGNLKLKILKINKRPPGSLDFLDSWSPPPLSLRILKMYGKPLRNFPQWITPALTRLSILSITLSKVTEEGLRTLGELPALHHLQLSSNPGQTDSLIFRGIGFVSLKRFSIAGAEYVTFARGAMPKLEKLWLSFNVSAATTYGFYLGLEHLPSLKDFGARLISRSVTSSESDAAATAVMDEAGIHPNHPRVVIDDRSYIIIKKECDEGYTRSRKKSKEDGDREANQNGHPSR